MTIHTQTHTQHTQKYNKTGTNGIYYFQNGVFRHALANITVSLCNAIGIENVFN